MLGLKLNHVSKRGHWGHFYSEELFESASGLCNYTTQNNGNHRCIWDMQVWNGGKNWILKLKCVFYETLGHEIQNNV